MANENDIIPVNCIPRFTGKIKIVLARKPLTCTCECGCKRYADGYDDAGLCRDCESGIACCNNGGDVECGCGSCDWSRPE